MTNAAALAPARSVGTNDALSVLLIGDGLFPDQLGGLNRYLYEFQAAATQNLNPRSVVVGPASDPPPGTLVVGSRTDPLPVRLARTAAAIRRAARTADVIDCHFPLYGALPLAGRANAAKPLVVHFHGPWAAESNVGGERSELRLRVKRFVEHSVFARARAFVVLSRAFRSLLVGEYGVSGDCIEIIRPGVDVSSFRPSDRAGARQALGLGETERVVVTVRRLVPRMGIDVLLRAWAALTERGLAGARVLIVGEGPERARLEGDARKLGIGDAVRFLGAVDEPSLGRCYNAADVCVLPSVSLEGFGLVALEALACGTPVIGTDAGGLPEVLEPLDPSLVVASDDSRALADRLGAALSASESLPGRERCRRYAEGFSWSRVVDRHVELYRRVCSGASVLR